MADGTSNNCFPIDSVTLAATHRADLSVNALDKTSVLRMVCCQGMQSSPERRGAQKSRVLCDAKTTPCAPRPFASADACNVPNWCGILDDIKGDDQDEEDREGMST